MAGERGSKEVKENNLPQDRNWWLDQEHKLHGTSSCGCTVVAQERQASKSVQRITKGNSFKEFGLTKPPVSRGKILQRKVTYLIYIASPSLIHSILLQVIEIMNIS